MSLLLTRFFFLFSFFFFFLFLFFFFFSFFFFFLFLFFFFFSLFTSLINSLYTYYTLFVFYSQACNGAANFYMENKFKVENGSDPATINQPEGCSEKYGYKNGSFLCAACADGFSHSGLADKCEQCPLPSVNATVAVVGILFGLLGLFVFIRITISDAGNLDGSDGAKSIGMTYLQTISLLVSFPIAWPPIFTMLFKVGGAIAVLGQHLVNVKCMADKGISAGDIFLGVRIVWAILPVLLPMCTMVVWYVVSKVQVVRNLQNKIRSSVVAVLVRNCFFLFVLILLIFFLIRPFDRP